VPWLLVELIKMLVHPGRISSVFVLIRFRYGNTFLVSIRFHT